MSSASKPPVPDKGKKPKASKETPFQWTPTLMKQYLELLIGYQRKYGRDQGFSWVVLTIQFEEETGLKCGNNTLKNKHATMKERWKAWKELMHGETGLGWDYEKGCIMATDEWWERKCQEKADFGKLKNKCVPPDIVDAWDQIYGGTVATGKHCVSPSMDPVDSPVPMSCTPDDGGDDHRPQPTAADVNLGDDVEYVDQFDLHSFPELVRGATQSSPVRPVEDSYALCRVFKKNGICNDAEEQGQCSGIASMESPQSQPASNSYYEMASPSVPISSPSCVEEDKDDSWMQFITDDPWCSIDPSMPDVDNVHQASHSVFIN